MGEPVRIFKRQSGQMKAVANDTQEMLDETKTLIETVIEKARTSNIPLDFPGRYRFIQPVEKTSKKG